MKPISKTEYEALPDKMLYAIAKPHGDGHVYLLGNGDLAALPKYSPGRTMLRDAAYLKAMEDPEADGIGQAMDDDWRFIPLKASKTQPKESENPKLQASPRFAVFSPFSAPENPDAHFPVNVFSEPYRSYCEAVARSFQVDPVMPALNVLAIWSTIFQQHDYVVLVHPDWKEHIVLFLFLDAPPSEGKSPVLSYDNEPLIARLEQWNDENAPMIEASAAEVEILEKRISNLKLEMSKGTKSTKKSAPSRDDLTEAQERLREAKENQVFEQQWLLDDCTAEALEEALKANGETAAVLSSESGLLGIMRGRYGTPGSGVNLDLFLKSYTVESKHSVRIGRGRTTLRHPRMTIFLMTQPKELNVFINDEVMEGRGMCARFLYATPHSRIGSRVFEVETVPPDVRASYEEAIKKLTEYALEWKPEDTTITLSEDARKEFAAFWNEFEKTLPGMDAPMQEWAGKLRGNVIRIAGLLHLAESKGIAGEISGDTMRGAIEIGRYFITQAAYVFASYSESKAIRDARYILEKLMSDNFRQFREHHSLTRKELYDRAKCSRFPSVESLYEGLQELEQRGYICQETIRTGEKGRPSCTIHLNPEAFQMPPV